VDAAQPGICLRIDVGRAHNEFMTPRTTKWTLAIGLLVFWGILGTVWFIQWDRNRRVEWWMEHHYPFGWTSKLPKENWYFPSYDAWADAGREISGVEGVLLRKYAAAGPDDRGLLFYCMGAIHGPETLEFLRDTLFSTDDEDLQDAILNALWFSIGDEGVQRVLLEYVKDPRFPVELRCAVLWDLATEEGNPDAIAYVESDVREMLLQAWEEGSHIRGMTAWNEEWSLGLPPFPTIWELIEEEVAELQLAKAVLPEESSPDYEQAYADLQTQREASIERIERCYGRDGFVAFIEGYEEVKSRVVHEQGSEMWSVLESFALDVVKKDRDCPDLPMDQPRPAFVGLVIATLADGGRGDENALIKLTAQGVIYGGWLRCFWWEECEEKVEAALKGLEGATDDSPARTRAIACLRSTLASYEYVQRLEEGGEYYWDFEWLLWQAYALAPRNDEQNVDTVYQYVADELAEQWQDEYELFVLRIFEEPTSLDAELEIAVHLVDRLSPENREKLAKIAASDSPHAAYANRAMAQLTFDVTE
jgi:hypothetical protein